MGSYLLSLSLSLAAGEGSTCSPGNVLSFRAPVSRRQWLQLNLHSSSQPAMVAALPYPAVAMSNASLPLAHTAKAPRPAEFGPV